MEIHRAIELLPGFGLSMLIEQSDAEVQARLQELSNPRDERIRVRPPIPVA